MTALPWDLLPDTAAVDGDGHLMLGGCDTVRLAAEHGTPLFIYDEAHLRARCREAVAAFGPGAVYASKAFLCRAMARLAHEEGMAIDVSTGGELHVCLDAGVPAERLVFHGNNKSRNELRRALEAGVGWIVVDSFDELDRLQSLHEPGRRPPRILLRVTPGVEAHTHEFVSTGRDDSKFGFTLSTGAATRAVEEASSSTAVDLVGIHAHIGSQVFRVESFGEALRVVADFARTLDLPELSIGGGLGVAYIEGESAPSITEWALAIKEAASTLGVTAQLFAEPGRAIAAQAAITVYTVGTVKVLPGIRTYVAVDGGMSDNPRPILYGSGYETFVPARVNDARPSVIRLVGKHCESGDVLVLEGRVPEGLEVGDFIGTPVTGAYGHSMGSNYNKVLRPAIVFAADGEARLVVRRETVDDLLNTDLG
jgi:diaminopimelate decarboxylase